MRAAAPQVPITTNLMNVFCPLDYHKWAKEMDIVSWDCSPRPHDSAASIAFSHALMRGLKEGQPFLLMEQSPSQANWHPYSSKTSMKHLLALAPLLLAASCSAQPKTPLAPQPTPALQTEKFGRGVIALVQDDQKVWVSWRLLPGEEKTAFNLYRSDGRATTKLNDAPLTGGTNFVDASADLSRENRYFVRVATAHTESSAGQPFVLKANTKANTAARPYFSIPLQTPAGYAPNDAAVGDLDGDGEVDLVLHQAGRGKDNSQNSEADPPILRGIIIHPAVLELLNSPLEVTQSNNRVIANPKANKL